VRGDGSSYVDRTLVSPSRLGEAPESSLVTLCSNAGPHLGSSFCTSPRNRIARSLGPLEGRRLARGGYPAL